MNRNAPKNNSILLHIHESYKLEGQPQGIPKTRPQKI